MYFDIKCFQYFQFISHSFVIGDHSCKYTCLKFLYIVFLGSFHYFLHSSSHNYTVHCSTINLIPLEDSVIHSTKFFLHA